MSLRFVDEIDLFLYPDGNTPLAQLIQLANTDDIEEP